ncbi:hypothetical protein Nepgr_008553 [Nepenthes gracilis]|uniref:Glycosyltransferase n=1 Tax=Nepenthes gracilis TaxID=150966 RepID=A0AAD3S950_NEPGR|nr:hypothetical protein Nepgr_008553 [Nepenthes gracilis]
MAEQVKKAELIFIPLPGMGHLIPAVAMAKRLVERDERICITILVIDLPLFLNTLSTHSLESDAWNESRISFIHLPQLEKPLDTSSRELVQQMIRDYRPIVKQIVKDRVMKLDSGCQLAGFVVDLFCTAMVDVANELDVPYYVFFTSGAALLCLLFHFQSLRENQGVHVSEFKDPISELDIPGFRNRVPRKFLPSRIRDKDGGSTVILDHGKRSREAKGLLINTFMELESHAIHTLSNDDSLPLVYPVGPVINLKPHRDGGEGDKDSIMAWLDDQPPSSVVFLCFGSMGSFSEEQVREIAHGLERSGHRFLWSVRRPPTADEKVGAPREYENLEKVLPDGFLDRTAGIGIVIGWAPQVAILSHPAVGGFVSHCGWNSTLESVWFGVPIAAWPMYAEQQMNAFHLVKELGLAIEIQMDYRWDNEKKSSNVLVEAEEVEKGLRKVMDMENEVRSKVKEMSELTRDIWDSPIGLRSQVEFVDKVLLQVSTDAQSRCAGTRGNEVPVVVQKE